MGQRLHIVTDSGGYVTLKSRKTLPPPGGLVFPTISRLMWSSVYHFRIMEQSNREPEDSMPSVRMEYRRWPICRNAHKIVSRLAARA